jgi:hypothetical protein
MWVLHFKHKTKYEVHKSNNLTLIGQHEPGNCTLKNKISPPYHMCPVSHIFLVNDGRLLWCSYLIILTVLKCNFCNRIMKKPVRHRLSYLYFLTLRFFHMVNHLVVF